MSQLSSLTISNDGFAFDVTTGESYTLNRCARSILSRLRSGETPDHIIQAIANEFGVAQSLVERDVSDFFQILRTLGLKG
ncbi:MAG: PqqD family protein [Oculatellaceae cyanobacterium bins.114]|nr:PqqD family protein [Oculatellaceae cyanobacterium bins.114]